MLTHNSYFNAAVQSLGFERHNRKQSVGVITPGEYHFGTEAAERMTVVSGELQARFTTDGPWVTYAMGSSFEIAGKSGFDVKAAAPTAYLCEYL
jgi:uncharacterized protein YaiE (UPF0345 family)